MCAYLNEQLDGTVVGFGGSETAWKLGLYQSLGTHNQCLWLRMGDDTVAAMDAPNYICSANGVAETGELVNIDGRGNRVAATLFGKKKLFFIIGENKIAPDLESAIHRARNVAGPLNARRLNRKTPCAMGQEVKCYDCKSPERICAAMVIHWQPPGSVEHGEVILVRQELGF